jgi:hypothetical protein
MCRFYTERGIRIKICGKDMWEDDSAACLRNKRVKSWKEIEK